MLLHAGGPLAGLYLLQHRPQRRRERGVLQLALEAGQRDPAAVQLQQGHQQGRRQVRADWRAAERDHVHNGPVFHDDVHDIRGIWECRC